MTFDFRHLWKSPNISVMLIKIIQINNHLLIYAQFLIQHNHSILIISQKISHSSRILNVPSINVDLPYPYMITITQFIQIIYKNEPKLPKKFKIPFNVNCDFVHFKVDISDYHKIDMNFQKGFKIESFFEKNSIQLNTDNDLCASIFVPKGTCSTFDRNQKRYRILMKASKGQVDIVNLKVYKIYGKSYDFYMSPMFVYMPYFRVSIIKCPNFCKFKDDPPTLVHFIFNFKNFRIIILKDELTAKIEQANYAKASAISEMQLRLQKFFSILRNNQAKSINEEEVDKTFKEIRFKLFREALRKIHDHEEDNNNGKFATFVMKSVILDIDGFHFKSKKSIIENLTQNDKYKSLKLTEDQIGKINSVKLVIKRATFDIFSNINTQFSQYEICKMKVIYYGIEFHFLDKKPISHRDYFLNELTLDGEKIGDTNFID